jgi:hypothetical protein
MAHVPILRLDVDGVLDAALPDLPEGCQEQGRLRRPDLPVDGH